MSKTINVSIPDDWAVRRKKLKVQWKKILLAGIMFYEGQDLGEVEKPPPPKAKQLQGEFEIFLDGEVHVLIDRQWEKVNPDEVEAGQIFRIVRDGKLLNHHGHHYGTRRRAHILRHAGHI